eukprot:s3581_g8.t1
MADEDDRRDPRRRGDADGVPEGTEPRPGDGPPPTTEAPASGRPNSPPGKPPRRESSSNSRGGLRRDARQELDEHPRRREDADRDRHRRSGGENPGDADRAAGATARPASAMTRAVKTGSRTVTPGLQAPLLPRRSALMAAPIYNFGYGLPWPQAQARAHKEWIREYEGSQCPDRGRSDRSRTRPRSRVALTEAVPEPPDPPRASSHADGRRQDKEEDRRRDAKNEKAISISKDAAKASEGDRRADRGAASKKRSAPSKASTEVKKEDPPKEKTKPKKEATSSDSYEEAVVKKELQTQKAMANEERKRSAQAVSQRAQTQQAKAKAKAKAGPKAAAAAPPAEDKDLQDSTNKGYYLQLQADIEKVLQEFGGEDFCKAMPLSIGGDSSQSKNELEAEAWAQKKAKWKAVLLSLPCNFTEVPTQELWQVSFNKRQAVLQDHESLGRTALQAACEIAHLKTLVEAQNSAHGKLTAAALSSELLKLGLQQVVAGNKDKDDDGESETGSLAPTFITQALNVHKNVVSNTRCVELLMELEARVAGSDFYHTGSERA